MSIVWSVVWYSIMPTLVLALVLKYICGYVDFCIVRMPVIVSPAIFTAPRFVLAAAAVVAPVPPCATVTAVLLVRMS